MQIVRKLLYLPALGCLAVAGVILVLEFLVWETPYPDEKSLKVVVTFFVVAATCLAVFAFLLNRRLDGVVSEK